MSNKTTDERCYYDYGNKCDCSEDDRCGCTFPNNLPHDFDCDELYIGCIFSSDNSKKIK